MTYGISLWIPYHGTGTVACANAAYYGSGKTPVEPYAFWSNSAPEPRLRDRHAREGPRLRGPAAPGRAVAPDRPYYYGDFYPADCPTAWTRPRGSPGSSTVRSRAKGMVQAFRRAESPYESIRLKLGGLDPDAVYTLTDFARSQRRR